MLDCFVKELSICSTSPVYSETYLVSIPDKIFAVTPLFCSLVLFVDSLFRNEGGEKCQWGKVGVTSLKDLDDKLWMEYGCIT